MWLASSQDLSFVIAAIETERNELGLSFEPRKLGMEIKVSTAGSCSDGLDFILKIPLPMGILGV